MADPIPTGDSPKPSADACGAVQNRKERRKALKKLKRKQIRREAAIREREEEEAQSNDPEEQERIRLREQEEAEAAERARKEFEERERLWLEAARRKAEEEEEEKRRRELLEESEKRKEEDANELKGDDEWEYVEDGPAEIIWQGNEIIVKKKRVKVAKNKITDDQEVDRPTSNPLPPQSVAFASYNGQQHITAQELLEGVTQQVPNFGTEQDKAHCPFHLKTGACRFGTRCSRVHFYPDKSCTLLMKNMYNGPGLAWEQDEGLEYTDEEVERCYEEFYEDVHTEFLKFGELVNFKVCKNGSYHLRGNVYVHYKCLESAILAYNTMNGRYFAGKQITCEFVGVTRWKIAICGEYMKSRLRTCSRGTACNFIHCFRNPGGDYEWADWDNPPPRYWIRKMAVLFGYSDEPSYDRQMETKDLESPRNSHRRRTPLHDRYHTRRSHDRMESHDSDSGGEGLNGKRDRQRGDSTRRRHSRSRKDAYFSDKSERFEETGISKVKVSDDEGKTYRHTHHSGENRSKDRRYHEKYLIHENKNHLEDHQRYNRSRKTKEESYHYQEGEAFSDREEKSDRKHRSKPSKGHRKEHRLSHQHSNYTNNRSRSTSPASEEYLFSHRIDAEDRNDGRHCSSDSDSDSDFSYHSKSRKQKQDTERREDRSRTHDNGKVGEIYKGLREENHDYASICYGSSGRWEMTVADSDREETGGSLHGRDGNTDRRHGKNGGFGRKKNHHRRKRKHKSSSSDSDDELDDRARKKHSRGRSSSRCSGASLIEKRLHHGSNDS